MNKPLVSITMSTYNDSAYLKEAIGSVLQQSFSDWEFIILNDASTDETEKIIKYFVKKDKRFKYHINKKNQGQTKNLITCAELAKGKFIARIDGDDIWNDKNKLREQVNFLESNPEYGLVGSFWTTIDRNGKKISEITYPIEDLSIRKYLLIENCFLHSSVLIRKSVLEKTGNYDIQHHYAQDYDLWLRIGMMSKLYNIPKFMVNYRINPNGMTQTNYKAQLQDTYNIVKKYKHDYPNFIKGYILWHLRTYFPKSLKEKISKILYLVNSK